MLICLICFYNYRYRTDFLFLPKIYVWKFRKLGFSYLFLVVKSCFIHYFALVLKIGKLEFYTLKEHCLLLLTIYFSVMHREDTEKYHLFLLEKINASDTKQSLMWLESKALINSWGSPLSLLLGCRLHSPGGSRSGKKARTYQSRKACAQFHDGYSADQKSK